MAKFEPGDRVVCRDNQFLSLYSLEGIVGVVIRRAVTGGFPLVKVDWPKRHRAIPDLWCDEYLDYAEDTFVRRVRQIRQEAGLE